MKAVLPRTAPSGAGSAPTARAVGIVASAGGIPATLELLGDLPADFPYGVILAQHLPREGGSWLPDLLGRRTRLACAWLREGDVPRAGSVRVVPPGMQAEVNGGGVSLRPLGPRSSDWLGVADALLASLARTYGPRAIGIMLSGSLGCGLAGLRAIRAAGGLVMAQNEASSLAFAMPRTAIDVGKVDFVGSTARLAEGLVALADLDAGRAALPAGR